MYLSNVSLFISKEGVISTAADECGRCYPAEYPPVALQKPNNNMAHPSWHQRQPRPSYRWNNPSSAFYSELNNRHCPGALMPMYGYNRYNSIPVCSLPHQPMEQTNYPPGFY